MFKEHPKKDHEKGGRRGVQKGGKKDCKIVCPIFRDDLLAQNNIQTDNTELLSLRRALRRYQDDTKFVAKNFNMEPDPELNYLRGPLEENESFRTPRMETHTIPQKIDSDQISVETQRSVEDPEVDWDARSRLEITSSASCVDEDELYEGSPFIVPPTQNSEYPTIEHLAADITAT